jgi:DNA-binding NarL/FixJ family response regulator
MSNHEHTAREGGRPIRVVIADDSVLLREGLVRLLSEEGFDVVAAVGDASALLTAASAHRPDLAVVDVRMPPTHTDEGLQAAVTLRATHPGLAICVLSQYVEERYAGELLAAAGGGAGIGYLLKERVADVRDFVEALRRVAAGGTAFDAEVVGQLLGRRRASSPIDTLTSREREVLGLMAEGRSNVAIARTLAMSEGSVEKHVTAIFGKLALAPMEADHRRVLAVLAWLQQRP